MTPTKNTNRTHTFQFSPVTPLGFLWAGSFLHLLPSDRMLSFYNDSTTEEWSSLEFFCINGIFLSSYPPVFLPSLLCPSLKSSHLSSVLVTPGNALFPNQTQDIPASRTDITSVLPETPFLGKLLPSYWDPAQKPLSLWFSTKCSPIYHKLELSSSHFVFLRYPQKLCLAAVTSRFAGWSGQTA